MQKKLNLLILAFCFIISLVLYFPTLKSFFLSDDWTYLSTVKSQSPGSFFLNNIEGKREGGVYRPLVSLSFWLNYKISGLIAWPYHLFNILIHALNAGLLFFLISKIEVAVKNSHPEQSASAVEGSPATKLRDSLTALRLTLPLLVALFFLILPSQTETVTWLSARGDLLATTFFLSSLIIYLHFKENKRSIFYLASLAAFMAALLAKEMALTLPLVVILLDLFFERAKRVEKSGVLDSARRPRSNSKYVHPLPYFGLVIFYLGLRLYATGILFGFYAAPNLNFNLGVWLNNFLGYGASLFFYGTRRAAALTFLSAHYYYGWLIFLSFLALTVVWVKRRSLLFLAWSFFLLTILPVLSLHLDSFDVAGERVLYLPSLGLALILALIFTEESQIFSKLLGGALAIYFIFFTIQRALVWQAAGQLTQNLLTDFAQTTELPKKNTGVVILGLPDSLSGAYVWRNGFFAALSLLYPEYEPDLLLAQPKLKLLKSDAAIIWQRNAPGQIVGTTTKGQALFFGPASLASLDYKMEIKNYQPRWQAGDKVACSFTPAFVEQFKHKKILFLAYNQGHLSRLDYPRQEKH